MNKLIYFSLFNLFFILSSLKAQEIKSNDKIINIINADELEVITEKGVDLRKLLGNVQLQQGTDLFSCDSAYFYTSENNLKAFGNIHIQQGDSVSIKSDKLLYNGNEKKAILNGNVQLDDQKSLIKSEQLTYYMIPKKAVLKNAALKNEKANVTSKNLTYLVKTKQAHLSTDVKLVDTEQNVVTSDEMDYNINTQEGVCKGNAKIINKASTIIAPIVNYNVSTQEGSYTGGGTLINKESTLKSQNATYNGLSKKVIFTNNVQLQSPKYTLNTQQLNYDLESENAEFTGESTILSDGSTIHSKSGTYNPKTDALTLNERSSFVNKNQNVQANNFYYNKLKGIGQAQGQVEVLDTAQNINLKCENAIFYTENEKIKAFGKLVLTQISENKKDTFIISADTLITYKTNNKNNADTTKKQNYKAYKHVKIWSTSIQAVCDSLAYSELDSLFKLYYEPIIWSQNYQLRADTILILSANNKLKKANLNTNAFIANKLDTYVFNQLKGDHITAFFADSNQIKKVLVNKNSECIYFAQDDAKNYIGVNKAEAANIVLFFNSNTIERINFYEKPNSIFYPIQDINPKKMILKGFMWDEKRKPLKLTSFLF